MALGRHAHQLGATTNTQLFQSGGAMRFHHRNLQVLAGVAGRGVAREAGAGDHVAAGAQAASSMLAIIKAVSNTKNCFLILMRISSKFGEMENKREKYR